MLNELIITALIMHGCTAIAAPAPRVIAVKMADGQADFSAALAAVKESREKEPHRPVTVELPDGRLWIKEPLVMTPEHGGTAEAPVIWQAAAGAHPVIAGGRSISGFRQAADGTWQIKLQPGAHFEQMWVNGLRTQRARFPNEGFFNPVAVSEEKLEEKNARQTVTFDKKHLAPLAELSLEELKRVQMLAYHKWDNTRRFLGAVDQNAGTILTMGEPMKPWNRWDQETGMIFENVRIALDAPGEWFLAADGLLTYKPRPGETLEKLEVIAPATPQLLVMRGAPEKKLCHVVFRGIGFAFTGWEAPPEGFSPQQAAASIEAAVQADFVEGVSLENCQISHTGGYGLWFRRGCTGNRVVSCYLHDLGAGGLRVGDTSPAGGETGHNLLDNNIIRDGGLVFPCAVAVWIGDSGDNRVSRHEISYFPYTGISLGWRWGYGPSSAKRNVVEYNHIHHIGDGLLSDMGGIYTLGPSEGTVLRHNHIHHITSYKYGGWGLYNDEGSTGILMENNLVHHTTSGGYHQHYGRDNIIRNNIFAYARDQQLQFTRAEDHLSFTFTGNIVLWESGQLLGGSGWNSGKVQMDRNLYWQTNGDAPRFLGQSLPKWRETGRDQHSLVADPLFQNAPAGIWKLTAKSPAFGIGFAPFDVRAGVQGEPVWIRLANEKPVR